MSKILKTLRHEFIQVLPPTIFFFVTFNLISITKSLMLLEHGIDFSGFATATVGALLVGKVVLVTDKLPFMNQFPEKPLIYNVLWKTMIYVIAVFLVRYLEHIVPFFLELGSLGLAHQHLMDEVVWARFWSVQIWLMTLFFVYTSLHEAIRVIGREEALRMFFGKSRTAGT
jgi:hypothetical protein